MNGMTSLYAFDPTCSNRVRGTVEVDRRAILGSHESLTAAQATTVGMDVAIMGWAG